MFCKQCGMQVADGVPYCPGCGSKVGALDGSTPPDYPIPVEVHPPYKTSKRPWVLMAICMIVATVMAVGVLAITGQEEIPLATPESVAQAVVEAEFTGDMEAWYAVSVGDVRGAAEYAWSGYEDEVFEEMAYAAEDVGLDLTVDSWDSYYSAQKEITDAALAESYGEDYVISTEIKYSEDMDEEVLDACRTMLTDDACIDYINPELITEGKFMAVELYVEGSEDYDYHDFVVPVVKYDDAWTALSYEYYLTQDDYESNRDQRKAMELLEEAMADVQANVE